MDKPYIKLYKVKDGISFYIIDGDYVRKNIDGQFTNFAMPSHYPYGLHVPKGEAWLDKSRNRNEYDYYIANILAQLKAIKEGKDQDEVFKEGDEAEVAMRKQGSRHPIKLKKLETYANIDVFLVNGDEVCKQKDISYTEGGHDLIYHWIVPKKGRGEIWMDNRSPIKDRPFEQLHEMREHNKMALKMVYGHGSQCTGAHASASHEEREARHNPALLKSLMEREREIARIIFEEGTGEKARKHIAELNKDWNKAIKFDWTAHNGGKKKRVKRGYKYTHLLGRSLGSFR